MNATERSIEVMYKLKAGPISRLELARVLRILPYEVDLGIRNLRRGGYFIKEDSVKKFDPNPIFTLESVPVLSFPDERLHPR